MNIRVVIVEDNERLRSEVAQLVARTPGFEVVGEADSVRRARAWAGRSGGWDVALVDLGLPDGSGAELVREWKRSFPDRHSIVCTVFEDRGTIVTAIAAGASGYLLKRQMGGLCAQIRLVMAGGAPLSGSIAAVVLDLVRMQPVLPTEPDRFGLTPREIEVLRALKEGATYQGVATQLGIEVGTVQTYIRSIYRKLQVENAVRAVVLAIERGLI